MFTTINQQKTRTGSPVIISDKEIEFLHRAKRKHSAISQRGRGNNKPRTKGFKNSSKLDFSAITFKSLTTYEALINLKTQPLSTNDLIEYAHITKCFNNIPSYAFDTDEEWTMVKALQTLDNYLSRFNKEWQKTAFGSPSYLFNNGFSLAYIKKADRNYEDEIVIGVNTKDFQGNGFLFLEDITELKNKKDQYIARMAIKYFADKLNLTWYNQNESFNEDLWHAKDTYQQIITQFGEVTDKTIEEFGEEYEYSYMLPYKTYLKAIDYDNNPHIVLCRYEVVDIEMIEERACKQDSFAAWLRAGLKLVEMEFNIEDYSIAADDEESPGQLYSIFPERDYDLIEILDKTFEFRIPVGLSEFCVATPEYYMEKRLTVEHILLDTLFGFNFSNSCFYERFINDSDFDALCTSISLSNRHRNRICRDIENNKRKTERVSPY